MNNSYIIGIALLAIGMLLLVTATPINDNIDVVSTVTVSTHLIGEPEIQNVQVEVVPHTLFRINSIAGLISSDLTLAISGGGKSNKRNLGMVLKKDIVTTDIILTNVPKTTSQVKILLYEDMKLVDTKVVKI